MTSARSGVLPGQPLAGCLLAELGDSSRGMVPMVMGVGLRECPLLVPVKPVKIDDVTAAHERMAEYAVRQHELFPGDEKCCPQARTGRGRCHLAFAVPARLAAKVSEGTPVGGVPERAFGRVRATFVPRECGGELGG
jgi:hypothetical protein